MAKKVGDYEESERIAILNGKAELAKAPWLFNRSAAKIKGFFVGLVRDPVNGDYCEVHCADGDGTKLFTSAWSRNYSLTPIDGVAMNANDMATIINAFPTTFNLYIAAQTNVKENHMGEIMRGFVNALERIRIPHAPWDLNIGKIETASLDEMISLGVPGMGVDYGVVMSGRIRNVDIPNLDPQPGNVIVGVSSTGLHSNGYTGARHVLLKPSKKLEYRDEWRKNYHE